MFDSLVEQWAAGIEACMWKGQDSPHLTKPLHLSRLISHHFCIPDNCMPEALQWLQYFIATCLPNCTMFTVVFSVGNTTVCAFEWSGWVQWRLWNGGCYVFVCANFWGAAPTAGNGAHNNIFDNMSHISAGIQEKKKPLLILLFSFPCQHFEAGFLS